RKVTKRIKVAGPDSLWDVIYAAGAVWGTDYVRGTVIRIDPRTNRVVRRIAVGESPSNLRYGAGAIWVGSQTGHVVFRIDPTTSGFTKIPVDLERPDSTAVSDTAVWVTDNAAHGSVTRIDPEANTVVATIPVGKSPSNPAIAPDGTVVVPLRLENKV